MDPTNLPEKRRTTDASLRSSMSPMATAAHASAASGHQMDMVKEYLAIAFKYKYHIVAVAFLTLCLSIGFYYVKSWYVPKMYTAKSILLLRYGREYAAVNPDPSGRTPVRFNRQDIFSTERMILNGRDLKERIIQTLGLKAVFPRIKASDLPADVKPLDAALRQFNTDLSIQSGRDGNLIYVNFSNPNPEVAAKVVNLLVSLYRKKRMQVLADPQSSFFMDRQAAEFRQRLQDAEDNLETFRKQYDVYSLDSELSALYTQRSALNEKIQAAHIQIGQLKQQLASLQSALKGIPKPGNSLKAAEISDLQSKLLDLKLKETDLLTKYTPNNLLVVNARKQIKMLQSRLDKLGKTSGVADSSATADNPFGPSLYDEVQKEKVTTAADLQSAKSTVSALEQQKAELQKKIATLNPLQSRWRQLQRNLDMNNKYYQLYLNKVEQNRISQDMDRHDMTSIEVIQPAVAPAIPSNLGKGLKFFIAAGTVGGIGLGVGLALLLNLLGQGLTTPAEAEKKLGLPVLTTIPFEP